MAGDEIDGGSKSGSGENDRGEGSGEENEEYGYETCNGTYESDCQDLQPENYLNFIEED